ncbi:peptidase M24 [halophilic archaeon DL31]|jgi:Xaa-Pro dipeptidase|nr:peptidase M24 [halophilic archaeon DL31]
MVTIHKQRRNALFEKLPNEVGTVLVPPSETLRYLTGLNMHTSERPTALVMQRGRPDAFVLPSLETRRVRDVVGADAEFFIYTDATDPVAAAKGAFAEFKSARPTEGTVAMEFRSARLVEYEVVESTYEWDAVVDLEDAAAALRGRKDQQEIEKLRTAASLVDDLLEETVEAVTPGMTEAEIEGVLHKAVIDSEADKLGAVIVVSGERSSQPHTNTSDRAVEHGDPLMIDAGVVYDGYYSDITRTFALGEASDAFREIYDVVQASARAARERVAEGVAFQEIDRASRTVIEDAGYGDDYPHRVGHGLGLEGHEPPYLVEGNEATLGVGHAFTVEPGIYVDGLGGVRIEDDMVITEDGPEVLTSFPRDLRIL